MIRCLVLLAALSVACRSTSNPFPFEYSFRDIPSERRIEVVFWNDLETGVCLTPDNWPNSAGKINQGRETMFLVIGGTRYPVVDFNTGYCPGCALYVPRGTGVTASIGYAEFGVPEGLANAEKALVFHPRAYRCRAPRGKPSVPTWVSYEKRRSIVSMIGRSPRLGTGITDRLSLTDRSSEQRDGGGGAGGDKRVEQHERTGCDESETGRGGGVG